MIGSLPNVASVYKVPSLEAVPAISPIVVDNFRTRMESTTDSVDLAVNKKAMSFEQVLLHAFDSLNQKQQATTALTEQMITNPDSVDAHDVTIAMAEASMSLKLAQTVIDKALKAWNDITMSR